MNIYLFNDNDEFVIGLKDYLQNNPDLLKNIIHDNIFVPWNVGKEHSDETKQLISERKTGVSINKGRKAPWASKNLSQIKHRAFGEYQITDPQGNTKIIINLKQYCLEHNLKYRSMSSLANGKWPSKTYKGYTAQKLGYAKIRQ
jgi:hypothetical protein